MKKHLDIKYVFFLLDVIILTAAVLLTIPGCFLGFWDWNLHSPYFYVNHFGIYLIFLSIELTVLNLNHAYKRNILVTRYRQFIIILKSQFITALTVAVIMFIFKIEYFYNFGKNQIFYFTMYAMLLFIPFRAGFGKNIFRILANKDICRVSILIVGGDEAGILCAKSLIREEFSDLRVVGIMDDYKEIGCNIFGIFHNLGKLDNLERLIFEHEVDEVLIAIDNAPYERIIQVAETCMRTRKKVWIYSNIFKIIPEKIEVEYYSSIPLITLSQTKVDNMSWKVKRILDILLSAVALVVLFPVFLIIMAGIKISSRGPVFYKQVRIGRNGKPFDFYKFRSMYVNNDSSNHKAFVQDFIRNAGACSQADKKVFKITNDPRIFKFGKFIRKTSLDELPQLFNVLKGSMTIVGPRPCLPYEWECYENWHKERLKSPPGCTGIWQAFCRNTVSFEEMVILDLYYISNTSFWLDLKIVLNTFSVIFLGKGGF